MLDATEDAVTSALKRARGMLATRQQLPLSAQREPAPPNSATEPALVDRCTAAFVAGDIDALGPQLLGRRHPRLAISP